MDKRAVSGIAVVAAVLVLAPMLIVVSLIGMFAGLLGGVGAAMGGDAEANATYGYMACDPGGELSATVEGAKVSISPEQFGNAVLIVNVGKQRRVPERGWVIAVATALQESKLINLGHLGERNDHDSLGLFQQRPSTGWGTPEQVQNPQYAATAFYGGPDVPPNNQGLLDVPNWTQLSLTQAAQEVQESAFPDAYAKWEPMANAIVGRAVGAQCTAVNAEGKARIVIEAALKYLGTPYCWAGGDARGPTRAAACANGPPGFDCSGLTLYAYAQIGITLGHFTGWQWNAGVKIMDRNALAPADLIFFSSNGTPGGIHHVGIYMGNGSMVHAPQTGDVVKVVHNIWGNSYYNREFIGGVRLIPPTR